MIKIIAAMSSNRCIGSKGKLPWSLPPDLNFFREMTNGHIVVMGRRTWDSLPAKPLANRTNVIISRDILISRNDVQVFRDAYYCFSALQNSTLETGKDIYVIGGGSLYRQVLSSNLAEEILLTEINIEVEGDTFFPALPEDKWKPTKILEGKYKDLSFVINRWTK